MCFDIKFKQFHRFYYHSPQHGTDPQPSAAPYKLLLTSNSLNSQKNEQVNVTIVGNSAGLYS